MTALSFFILALVLLGFAGLLIWVRRLKRQTARHVLDKFADRKIYGITTEANFFGQARLGIGQVRGNGVLVLVEGELYFALLKPRRNFRIPWESMQRVQTPRSHLGKSRGSKLLKVEFLNYHGQCDSMAWLVPNLDEWRDSLDKVISSQQRPGLAVCRPEETLIPGW